MKVCQGCGREIQGDYYQAVTAWVANGKRDSVTLRQDITPPRFACRSCIKQRQLKIPVGQGSLL